jgi:transposase
MAKPLSNDIRERIVRAVESGMSRNAAAQKYDVSPSTAVKIVSLWKTTGSWKPKKFGGHKKHKLAPHAERIKKLIEEKPDMTLEEIKTALAAKKINVGLTAIFRFLGVLGLNYKKNGTRQRTKQAGRESGPRGMEAKPRAA